MSIDAAGVKRLGRSLGFNLVRIARAEELTEERQRYLAWIGEGRQGEMAWITPERAVRSTSPQAILPGAQSVISVALSYWGGPRPVAGQLQGRIARYAWGSDYHVVMGDRLREFAERLGAAAGGEHRWYVDTGPAMDRAFAARSGLGWQGKNTNILTREFGSFVLLGEILTTVELAPDAPLADGCGSCRLCLVACPTGALGPEYSIDSRRCISYLTIEHRGPIPLELRPVMGSWVFGCDICQDVCPPSARPFLRSGEERRTWAAEVRATLGGDDGADTDARSGDRSETPALSGPMYRGRMRASVDLLWLISLSHEEYVETFRGTAIRRAKVWMLRRNAAVALGNVGDESCVSGLARTICTDEHPIVRGHAAWALGRLTERYGEAGIESILRSHLENEPDPGVQEEIRLALRAGSKA